MHHTPKFPSFVQLDIYIVRNELQNYIHSKSDIIKGDVLDIGCGKMPYKEWIKSQTNAISYTGLDIENPIYNDTAFQPDMYWDGTTIPIEENKYDTILLTEVLEHCEYPEKVINEAFRVLKPNGKLIFSVPFIMYYHDVPYDFHRYTYFKLKSLFENAHFQIDELVGYGDWHSSLAHFWGLWIRKSAAPKIIRFGVYLLGLPFYLLLYRKGKLQREMSLFSMVIGHFGVVTKPNK